MNFNRVNIFSLCIVLLPILALSTDLLADDVIRIGQGQETFGAHHGCTVLDMYAAGVLLGINPGSINRAVLQSIIRGGAARYKRLLRTNPPGDRASGQYTAHEAQPGFPELARLAELQVLSPAAYARSGLRPEDGVAINVRNLANELQAQSIRFGMPICGVFTNPPVSYLVCFINGQWLFFDSHDHASIHRFSTAAAMQNLLNRVPEFQLSGRGEFEVERLEHSKRKEAVVANLAVITFYRLVRPIAVAQQLPAAAVAKSAALAKKRVEAQKKTAEAAKKKTAALARKRAEAKKKAAELAKKKAAAKKRAAELAKKKAAERAKKRTAAKKKAEALAKKRAAAKKKAASKKPAKKAARKR